MQPIKSLIVDLDLTAIDSTIIKYSAFIQEVFEVESINFVHVTKDLEMDKVRQSSNYKGEKPFDEYLSGQLKKEIREHFPKDTSLNINIDVLEGDREKQLVHWALVKDADLIVVGLKQTAQKEKLEPYRLTRISPCSVLVVPEKINKRIQTIFIPIDNSAYTGMSFEKAERIANKIAGVEIIVYHLYNVPLLFIDKKAVGYRDFISALKEKAKEDIRDIIEVVDRTDNMRLMMQSVEGNMARQIVEDAKKQKADLVIMGSKGRTNAAAVLLGSITEKAIQNNAEVPMLILRRKHEHKGLLDTLLKTKT